MRMVPACDICNLRKGSMVLRNIMRLARNSPLFPCLGSPQCSRLSDLRDANWPVFAISSSSSRLSQHLLYDFESYQLSDKTRHESLEKLVAWLHVIKSCRRTRWCCNARLRRQPVTDASCSRSSLGKKPCQGGLGLCIALCSAMVPARGLSLSQT